jgi:DNA-3-methyladenine glycosylase II
VSDDPLKEAIRELARRDPVIEHLVGLAGEIEYRPKSPYGHFGALARAIVFQQLAGSAANAIFQRVLAVSGELTASAIAAAADADLRAAGLSANKLASLRDFSARVLSGDVDLERLAKAEDETVIAELSKVRGIGKWTAEMYLLFELRRMDVWPVDDLGVRTGYGVAWGLAPAPTAKQLQPLGDPFRPLRSVAAMYCWEAVHLMRGGTDLRLR